VIEGSTPKYNWYNTKYFGNACNC